MLGGGVQKRGKGGLVKTQGEQGASYCEKSGVNSPTFSKGERILIIFNNIEHHMALIAASILRTSVARKIIEVITKYPNKPTALSALGGLTKDKGGMTKVPWKSEQASVNTIRDALTGDTITSGPLGCPPW